MRLCTRWIPFCVLLLAQPASLAKTIYVDAYTENTTPNGISWQTPYKTIQDGLANAVSGDQIWAKMGSYDGPIVMKGGVKVYGGFMGNETSVDQRFPFQGGSQISGGGLGSTVTFGPGITSTTLLDNFYIHSGSGTLVDSYARGGGIYCNEASPTLNNLVISYNQATYGGAMWLTKSSPILTNSLVTANSSSFQCGGIYINQDSNPVLEYNTFQTNNVTSFGSGGEGGAMTIANGSKPEIRNNTFRRNYSSAYGGAIYCMAANPVIRNNVFIENESQHGAAVYMDFSGGQVVHNLIASNTASGHGGGILMNNATTTFTGNTIADNVAQGYGSGGDGGGIYVIGNSPLALANTIVAYNSSGIFRASGSTGANTLYNNDVFGNGNANYTGIANPGTANGNLSVDPLFMDRLFGDYHLRGNSPCVNAGRNASVPTGSTDLDRMTRTIGAAVDIGVDEFANPIYVSPQGNDSQSGSSWQNARKTIGAAVAIASPGDQVWVGEGVYTENVAMRPGVRILGGFPNGGTLTARSWVDHPCVIDGNQAGSAVKLEVVDGVRIDGFTIRNGKSESGGGIQIVSSSPIVTNCRITENKAVKTSYGGQGGGVYATGGSSPVLHNNLIYDNLAEAGGGVFLSTGEPIVVHNTIVGNTAASAGGLHFDTFSSSFARFANNIIANNTSGVNLAYQGSQMEPLFVANNVFGNAAANYTGVADLTGTNGNIQQNPMFQNPAAKDFRLGTGSPCIETGRITVTWQALTFAVSATDMKDYAGSPRIGGTLPDIGAYEYAAGTGFTFADALLALQLAGGTRVSTGPDVVRLNVEKTGNSSGVIDIRDALSIARKAAGLGPNP